MKMEIRGYAWYVKHTSTYHPHVYRSLRPRRLVTGGCSQDPCPTSHTFKPSVQQCEVSRSPYKVSYTSNIYQHPPTTRRRHHDRPRLRRRRLQRRLTSRPSGRVDAEPPSTTARRSTHDGRGSRRRPSATGRPLGVGCALG